METYTWLRTFADSWYLLFMALFFVGVIVWAFRPGSRQAHDESATMIFRNEDKPAARDDTRSAGGTDGNGRAR